MRVHGDKLTRTSTLTMNDNESLSCLGRSPQSCQLRGALLCRSSPGVSAPIQNILLRWTSPWSPSSTWCGYFRDAIIRWNDLCCSTLEVRCGCAKWLALASSHCSNRRNKHLHLGRGCELEFNVEGSLCRDSPLHPSIHPVTIPNARPACLSRNTIASSYGVSVPAQHMTVPIVNGPVELRKRRIISLTVLVNGTFPGPFLVPTCSLSYQTMSCSRQRWARFYTRVDQRSRPRVVWR